MPRNFESLPVLIQSVGIEKSTHYGKNFKVVSKADPSNAAYTTLPLGLHLDMPIYHYKPGVRNVKHQQNECLKPYYKFIIYNDILNHSLLVFQLQFLQCIEQYEFSGGENQFTDGFMIEKVMKERFHEEWKILSETAVVFMDENVDAFGDFNKVRIAPTFE